jgi:DNA-binding CsgD family transcriptional regulator
MNKSLDAETQLVLARQSLHSVIVEQGAITDELKAVTRELEALLLEVASRDDLLPVIDEASFQIPDSLPDKPPIKPELTVTQLKREADRVLQKGREAVHESASLRLRAAQLRIALRNKTPGDGHAALNAGQALTDGHRISKREHQVLNLMVDGKSSKEIAAALGISFKTAVTHRASIMGKLEVHEIASVVREAIRRGLV